MKKIKNILLAICSLIVMFAIFVGDMFAILLLEPWIATAICIPSSMAIVLLITAASFWFQEPD